MNQDRYLRDIFLASLPESLGRLRQIGCEEEFVVTDRYGNAADCRRDLFGSLRIQGWEDMRDDVHPEVVLGMRDPISSVIITTDAGWGVLEIVLPPMATLSNALHMLQSILALIIGPLGAKGYFLLGMGTQPRSGPSNASWIIKGRHDTIRTVLPEDVNQITLSASTQINVDVTRDEMITALNVFNALAGVFNALTANAPLLNGKRSGHLAIRALFWDMLVPKGSRRHGVGPRCADLQEYINYLLRENLLLAYDPSAGIYRAFNRPFDEYLQEVTDEVQRRHALATHQGSIWTDARFKSVGTKQGVIEVRPACQQPADAMMAVAALALGVAERLAAAQKLVDRYHWGEWRQLRVNAIQNGLRARTPSGIHIRPIAEKLLAIAQDGLQGRGANEEIFLRPLYDRLHGRAPLPAEELLQMLPQQELQEENFAAIVEARRLRVQTVEAATR